MRRLFHWLYLLDKKNRRKLISKGDLLDEVLIESNKLKEQKIVLDHHICYATKHNKPLCGQPLGKKGLSRNKSFTTCPECKRLIRKK